MQSISALPSSFDSRRLFEGRRILQSSVPINPSMESPERSTEVAHLDKAGFDSGVAIVLAALLFLILSALSVTAIVRCRLRCRQWQVESEPEIDVGADGVKGRTCEQIDIKELPTTVYRTGSPHSGMDCPICLAEFVEGEKVRVLPECCHSFHADCIDAWVVSNPSCPSCRHSLLYVMMKKSSDM